MTNKELIEKIQKDVLGIPKYGIEDEAIWGKFINQHFTRSGEINNEPYSSELNQTLSRAALSQTLNHIRFSLNQLIEEEG